MLTYWRHLKVCTLRDTCTRLGEENFWATKQSSFLNTATFIFRDKRDQFSVDVKQSQWSVGFLIKFLTWHLTFLVTNKERTKKRLMELSLSNYLMGQELFL